ncbi:T9SS type A sorting domain-containing protein [candidate division KSB1 bacterium]|nr:T9SS type A sorting domain-containing protein [candidate division KSB1 bacterium]
MVKEQILVNLLVFLLGWIGVLEGGIIELNPGVETPDGLLKVLASDDVQTRIGVSINALEWESVVIYGEEYQKIKLPDSGFTHWSDRPALPVITVLVAIPGDKGVSVEVLGEDSVLLDGFRLVPFNQDGDEFSVDPMVAQRFYAQDEFLPQSIVTISRPFILRDLRLVSLSICPIQYNPAKGMLRVYRELQVGINYQGRDLTNAKVETRPFSKAFDNLYRKLVVNYDIVRAADVELQPSCYLIITKPQYAPILSYLAEWKQRKGIETVVVTTDETGGTKEEILAYVQDAYDSETPPEYLLLVGDTPDIPHFLSVPSPATGAQNTSDHPYSTLDGDDYFPDLLVGRLSVGSTGELVTVISKIIGYDTCMVTTGWHKKALVVAGNYSVTPPIPTTPRLTKLWVREKMLNYGFNQVDTVFYPPAFPGTDEISNFINQGVSFVNYRGWGYYRGWHYPQFYIEDVQGLSNVWKLPVVTSMVCQTGDFAFDRCFGEAWLRVGTAQNPIGGIAFIGPSDLHTQTRHNNSIDAGFYWGILDGDIYRLGEALLRGKIELYNSFPNNREPGGWTEFYFQVYNILGDPELNMWTDIPQPLLVTHPDTIPLGLNTFSLMVLDSNYTPVPGALVCGWKDDETYVRGLTAGNGGVELPINPETEGTFLLTVTKHNFIPYLADISVLREGVFVGYENSTVDDDGTSPSQGNGDGIINPGETIELGVTLKNFGTTSAPGVTANLAENDPYVEIAIDEVSYGNIEGGQSMSPPDSFVFTVSPECPHNHAINFTLTAQDEGGTPWVSKLALVVGSAKLVYQSHTIEAGGDGFLDPGETAELTVTIQNDGSFTATGVTGILRANTNAVSVLDSVVTFGNINPGSQAVGQSSFLVQAEPSTYSGRLVGFQIQLTSGEVNLGRTGFQLTIGQVDSTAPLGPDGYGYFAYDHYDTHYEEAPVYDWVEIDPAYGGLGTAFTMADDQSRALPLPFGFRYYGQDYDTITVCSNGWIAMGSTWMYDFINWAIPAALGPYGMIAPFWDDLDSSLVVGGHENVINVFYWDDDQNHRFVVEWSRVLNRYNSAPETFEVILFDPVHYPTETGDGEILFQYHTINNVDWDNNFATVGIENPEGSDGIEYSYVNRYPLAAGMLRDSMAIKFTTDPPDTFFTGVKEKTSGVPLKFALYPNYPNPFNPRTVIRYDLPRSGSLRLRVFNLRGQEVARLVDGVKGPGSHWIWWDASGLPSGLYFYRLESGGMIRVRKCLLIK